jgi:hypothetical protein
VKGQGKGVCDVMRRAAGERCNIGKNAWVRDSEEEERLRGRCRCVERGDGVM